MFTHQRLTAIQNKIKTSKLLSEQEKGDWLSLLDLMNDKQLGELEEILSKEEVVVPAPAPTPSVPAPPTPPPPSTPSIPVAASPKPAPPLPPLTHIANVPTGMSAASFTKPTPPKPAPSRPAPSKPVQAKQAPPKPTPPKLAPTPTPTAPPPPPQAAMQSTGTAAYQLEHPEDLKNLTANDLRHYDLQSLINKIKDTIAQHGYFPILQLIEQSPLYDSYIQSGEKRLKGLSGDLNQTEFEFVTDLLIHMRFNKW